MTRPPERPNGSHARSDREGDLTDQFWGGSRDWDPFDSGSGPGGGEHRRSHRDDSTGAMRAIRDGVSAFRPKRVELRDETGQVRRTRVHGTLGTPTRQRPEPSLGHAGGDRSSGTSVGPHHLDRSTDDGWPDLDDWWADDRSPTVGAPVPTRRHAEVELVETRRDQPRPPFLDQFGLGGVDPLLARLGVMILLGALLVPFALALRPSTTDQSIRIDDSDTIEAPVGAESPAPTAPAPVESVPAAGMIQQPPAVVVADQSQSAAAPALEQAPVAASAPAADPIAAESPARTTPSGDEGASPATIAALEQAATVDAEAERAVARCPQTHTAGPGDSWFGIADAVGISIDDLLAENGATTETVILPGDDICLPEGATVSQPDDPPSTDAPTTTDAAAPEPTTTTSTAPPTSTTQPAPPPSSMSTEQIKQLIRDTFPEDPETALVIVDRESGFDPRADNNFCCFGLFQIYFEVHRGWLDDFGVTSADDLFDPVKNVRAARHLYEGAGGWSPWGF